MPKRAYADPAFVEEMAAIREQRHLAFLGRTGSGLPIGANGQPEPVNPNGPLALNNHMPIGTPQSTFRPSRGG